MQTAVALLALLALSSATPVSPPQPNDLPKPIRGRQLDVSAAPCAQVSQGLYFANGTTKPSVTAVPAKAAFDCMNSVPFNASSGKALVDALKPYVQWQSTLNLLKNPPAEYAQKVQPAIDILGGLDKMKADIDAGLYKSEYDFGWKLYTLIQSAHDGHFTFIPDSIGSIFTYGRTTPLVSVSEDGTKLPSVFAFQDVLGAQFKNISYTPSPVVQINGEDVKKYLEDLSQYGSLQDRDALYNNMFYSLAQVSLGSNGAGTGMFAGGGRGRYVYPGPTTTLTFANGSSSTTENFARVLQSFRQIQTGEDVADHYFYYNAAASLENFDETISSQNVAAAAPLGYPSPVVAGPNNLINAFYIDAPGYEDVAVLQVPNFVGTNAAEVPFQRTTQAFIPKALADGKKKLIIDVQANGGGTILQGYDMFKQLFPSIDPYGANRFRAIESIDLIGQSFSAWSSKLPRVPTKNSTILDIQSSPFDYHADTTVDGGRWSSWAEKFGPVKGSIDNYTSTMRWNLSDVTVTYSSGGINVTGYGPLSNVTQPTFEGANIVLLTDGYCASTCTILSELLTKQAGVKTIALGGRSNKNKIQAIGGVKGVNNYGFQFIQQLAARAVRIAPADRKEEFNKSVLATDYKSELVFARSTNGGGANVRDGLRKNDTSGIPLQFVYEAADCRLYYTAEMTVDATAMWKAAADAAWGGKGKCVTPAAYGKRGSDEVTTSLKTKVASETVSKLALLKFNSFEKTLDLQTDCKLTGDGFMDP
ncbi:hypothetical protein EJ04DRAFT_494169 [Polyplosphaeria fusca]|uniref:CPAF-like PDZ domain-containing protein n=1 Tax=Polyplosphaeria fusca TaxID=682080 RepID=A0A9P4QWZ2_9PLEO|nr:hypothetical protein EJ04DRAFT_494169 [Polyplosphaeria fusca]